MAGQSGVTKIHLVLINYFGLISDVLCTLTVLPGVQSLAAPSHGYI